MTLYDPNDVPRCQWNSCSTQATSQVYNENCTESIFVCRTHRGAVEINLETTGKLRLSQSSNQLSTDRPGKKAKSKIQRPKSNPCDWEKEAAKKADDAAVPVEPIIEEGYADNRLAQGQKAIVGDIPTPRKVN